MTDAAQRNLVLILARDFASRLATPVFLVDPDDNLIYFNEAAERLLGMPFVEGSVVTADRWSNQVVAADDEDRPLSDDERPLRVALDQRSPSHRSMKIRAAEGTFRRIEVTAFPLFAHADECVGAMSIFWEPPE